MLRQFCKGVKINHFSSEIIFGQLLLTFGDFFLVTLLGVSQRANFFKHLQSWWLNGLRGPHLTRFESLYQLLQAEV